MVEITYRWVNVSVSYTLWLWICPSIVYTSWAKWPIDWLMCLIYLHSVGLFLPLYSINEMVKITLNGKMCVHVFYLYCVALYLP